MSQPFLYAVEREYPVDIASLWSAWVEAEKLEAWYHPTDLSSVKGLTVSDLRLGGLWSCAVDVPQYNFVAYFFGQYSKIEPHKTLEHTLHYTQDREEFDAKDFTTPSHLIVVDFEERGDKSWVRFSQFGELPDGEASQAQAGMESYFDSLGNFLAKHA